MLTVSWRDGFVTGKFDAGGEGSQKMQRVYLGDGGVCDVVIGALATSGLADGWNTHLEWDDRWGGWSRTPVADAAAGRALCKASTGWCALAGDGVELRVFLGGSQSLAIEADVRAHDRLVERLVQLEAAVRERAPAELVRSPVLALRTRPVPRVRPRRRYAHWPADAMVLAVDRPLLERHIAGKVYGWKETEPGQDRYTPAMLAELDRLVAAPLPAGATRTTRGALTVFDFTGAAPTLGAAAAVYEGWLLEIQLERGLSPDDNELGDPAAPGAYQLQRAPEGSGMTLYNPYFGQAYSADVRLGRSITNPEKLDRLAAAKKAGKLPGGEKVTAVVLLVPMREDAVALAHLVAEGVVDSVAYVDGKSNIPRDPNVMGETVFVPWVEEQQRTKPAAKKKKPAAKKKSPPAGRKKPTKR